MWLYRRILRISWVDMMVMVSNEYVLERMNKGRKVINTIKGRRT